MDNLTVVLQKRLDIRFEQRPVPEPDDDEVLLRMDTVGICGSDVHYWTHGANGRFVVKAPMVLGHEASGVVVRCGSMVTHLKPGDRVAIEPGVPCRRCWECKSGKYNLCPDMKFCASPPQDGNLSRYYKQAADFCFKLPNNVSMEEGALIEPLAVAVHSCQKAGVTVGKTVLVCGAGPIGLVSLLTAKAMGASQVVLTDIVQNRLEMAKKLGATDTYLVDPDKDAETCAQEVVRCFKDKQQPDITIECCGVDSSLALGIYATRAGGVIVMVGRGPSAYATIPLVNAACREIDIRGLFRYANCYPTAIQMVASGIIDVKPLITHRFQLEDSLEAFETARTGKGGAIKVVIKC